MFVLPTNKCVPNPLILTDTFLQMCFQGIKIILAFLDSIFILCCTEVSFADDVDDGTGSFWKP